MSPGSGHRFRDKRLGENKKITRRNESVQTLTRVKSEYPQVVIHVLEDDPGVADALVVLIRQMGHEVVAYPDAEHFFLRKPPAGSDVLIVDLGLPGISGVQVVRWARELRDPPRIIAISGQSQSAINAAIGDMESPPIMRKPLREDALAKLL